MTPIAFSPTMSAEALQQHRIALAFNNPPSRAAQFAPIISQMIDRMGITEVLDYGCGNGALAAHLKADHAFTLQRYDPAHEDYAGAPLPMQMVVAIDVLQHVEPQFIGPVLEELKMLTNVALFAVIGPTTDRTPEAWFGEFSRYFGINTFQRMEENDCYIIAYSTKPVIEAPVEH